MYNDTQQINLNVPSMVNPVEDPVDDKPKKNVNILVILFGVMAVVFAGLAIFFGIMYFYSVNEGKQQEDSASTNEISEEESEVAVSAMAEEYNSMKNLMRELTSDINNDWGDYIENSSGLTYKPKWSNTHFPLKLNLLKKIKNGNNGESNVAILREKLEAAGFSSVGDLPTLGSAGPVVHGYYNSSKNVICGIYYEGVFQNINNPNDGYEFGALECGLADWIWLTSSEKGLASELETAYHDKTNEYPRLLDGLDAKPNNSQVESYQTISVSLGGAVGLFYRNGPDSKWQFFTVTQGGMSCDDFNTDDLKKAYAGSVCYVNGAESTVQP